MSQLICLGRHTVTGLLYTSGSQFQDWSAQYRLFSRSRFDPQDIFTVIRQGVLYELPASEPLVAAIDDSCLRKSGTKIPGVAYRRDPLSPPFHTNFIRAQRVLQISAALPKEQGAAPARMIPIDFIHAPTPPKPRKSAPAEEWHNYRRQQREQSISRKAAQRIQRLRLQLDQQDRSETRPLLAVVDGRFSNRPFIKNLPQRTTLIARIRGDAKLYYPPSAGQNRASGRKPSYGQRAPTPEQLRQDPSVPWQTASVFATGKIHQFKIKTIALVMWRPAGAQLHLRLIVIAPLPYRLRKGSKLLYKRPAYLICTHPSLPLEQVLQAYVWRWDIEVNFRDEKQMVGVGEAQVHSAASVQNAPALAVAAYGMILLAAHQAFGYQPVPEVLPPPKWRTSSPKPRASTRDLINLLRAELWGEALDQNSFSSFTDTPLPDRKPQKSISQLASAVLYTAA